MECTFEICQVLAISGKTTGILGYPESEELINGGLVIYQLRRDVFSDRVGGVGADQLFDL